MDSSTTKARTRLDNRYRMRMQVGQALRKARLQRGIDLYEVKRVTKIRVQTLRAMEEDRWDDVPAAEAEAISPPTRDSWAWTRRS